MIPEPAEFRISPKTRHIITCYTSWHGEPKLYPAPTKELIRKAKILAAQRDTSVSALLIDQLEALVKHDLEYQTAWAQWQELVQTLRLSNEGRP